MSQKGPAKARTAVLIENPLDGEQLLLDALFGAPRPDAPRRPALRAEEQPKEPLPRPSHYKIISISLYNEDLERLDAMVAELKRRGHHKANKSQLIRCALAKLNLDDVPKEP